LLLLTQPLIDGTGAAPRKLQQVLVDGKKIVAIGRHLALPDDAILYDLHGKVLMPGIIDSHVHFGNGYRVGLAGPHETEEYKDMRNMCLAHGVTTIRSGAGLCQEQRTVQLCGETGMTMGDVILGYIMSQPLQIIPVVQPNIRSQFKSTFHAIGARLTPEQIRFILAP